MSTSLSTCNVTSSNFSQRFWAIIHEFSINKLGHLIMKSRKDTMFIELKTVNKKRTGEIEGCIISNFYYKEIQQILLYVATISYIRQYFCRFSHYKTRFMPFCTFRKRQRAYKCSDQSWSWIKYALNYKCYFLKTLCIYNTHKLQIIFSLDCPFVIVPIL